jgi:hypothetical protein
MSVLSFRAKIVKLMQNAYLSAYKYLKVNSPKYVLPHRNEGVKGTGRILRPRSIDLENLIVA